MNKFSGQLIKHPTIWLGLAVIVVYFPTLFFGYTELDDSIFIRENAQYNQDLSNIITSFQRGLFNETDDIYYRPLFSVSMILNYQLSGIDIKSYHLINILLHLCCIIFVFHLLLALELKSRNAFILSLIFAIHPVLSQAVTWIPGRNDTLLALFLFPFMIGVINFSKSGQGKWLLLQSAFFLGALFTKETAVFVIPAVIVILILLLKKKWIEKRNLLMYGAWALAFAFYFIIRSQATLNSERLNLQELISTLVTRLPVLIQYLGKIILPVNLSVFPMQADTTIIYGMIALLLVAAGIYFSSTRNIRAIIAGIIFYVVFLIPVLIVPNSLNDQVFEHRLYIPIIGLLLVLSQTILLQNNWSEKKILLGFVPIVVVLATINFYHQQNFKSPVAFWSAAVKTSPSSAYAHMMLGMRMDKINKAKADSLIVLSYSQDPDAKYINYYMGKVQEQTSIEAAEKHYLRETEITGYADAYFELARMAFEKNDLHSAIIHLEQYLAKAPNDVPANNNLLLLYINTAQKEKARAQLKKMQRLGMSVPMEIVEQTR